MVTEALKRLRWEQRLRENERLAELEARRLAEVREAFFEGMAAGNDAWWHERPPEDYWLESDARRNLYAGPPKPPDPSKRAVIAIKSRGAPYDPQRDPERVLGNSFSPSKGRRRRRKR